MEAARTIETYTTDYIETLPEGVRAELINGYIYYMGAPNLTHQTIVGDLYSEIKDHIKNNNGKCRVILSPFAVYLNKDKKTYVEPDLSVVCDPSKLDDKGCHGAPDWIIEIVSQSSKTMDWFIKLCKYSEAGVREYWVVDPDDSSVTVYNYEKGTMEKYPFGKEVPAGIYEDFSLTITL